MTLVDPVIFDLEAKVQEIIQVLNHGILPETNGKPGGTSGQAWTSNGPNSVPTYQAIPTAAPASVDTSIAYVWTAQHCFDAGLKSDIIVEASANAGVTIENVRIRDGVIMTTAAIAQASVTQHQAALSIDYSQLTGTPHAPVAHTHGAADVLAGSFGTGAFTFDDNVLLSGGSIRFTGNGSIVSGSIGRSAPGGIEFQGINGSADVLRFKNAGSSIIFSVPINTVDVEFRGYIDMVDVAGEIRINGAKVVDATITGWTVPTGTATRSGYVTSTVTLSVLAEHVMALLEDLGLAGASAHGLISA